MLNTFQMSLVYLTTSQKTTEINIGKKGKGARSLMAVGAMGC